MHSLWSYPWTLAGEGLDDTWNRLNEIGIDAINLASHYHSVRSFQPRLQDQLFVQRPGGCYFNLDAAQFAETEIDPSPNDVDPFDDPVAEIVASADNHGIAVNGWVVLFHNSRLGATNPEYRIQDAFGHPHDHAICPSYPDVHNYFAAVVGAVADRGVDEIQLESIGYPTVFHGHGNTFGHDKRQVLTSPTEEILLSQCFCDGCRTAAESHPVKMNEAQQIVQELLEKAFAQPQLDLPHLNALLLEWPSLKDLFEFRSHTITRLIERIADAADTTPLNYYVMDGVGAEADDVWPAGVRFADLEKHVERVTALCYVRDPAVARQRITAIRNLIDRPVDGGITLDQDTIRNASEFRELVDTVRSEADGRLHFYHHSLMTDSQLEWIKSVT